MNRRRFGRTNIGISEMTLGGGFVGGLLLHKPDDVKRECIASCLDAGMNWIDTAADYGGGESEKAISWLVGELPAEKRPHISTKVRLDAARRDNFPDQVRASIEGSLERLRMDRVDLLILHNPLVPAEPDRATLTLDEALRVIDCFDRLREEGLFDHVGFTALGDGPTVRAAIASGRFDMAQVYYNMLNPTAGFAPGDGMSANWSDSDFTGLLDACREHDVGVMNIRIFAAGVLATDERHGREIPITANAEMAAEEARARAVRTALGERSETRSQTAIRFGLAHPAVSTVVFGVAEMAHVHQALAAPGLGPLEEDALAALRRAW
ncbi:MAG: aldo/keto reductase, partial [Alphaproteobacteria bacterium]|nr:aldo/keto reductase [Alphaproteobacteria bacterium]